MEEIKENFYSAYNSTLKGLTTIYDELFPAFKPFTRFYYYLSKSDPIKIEESHWYQYYLPYFRVGLYFILLIAILSFLFFISCKISYLIVSLFIKEDVSKYYQPTEKLSLKGRLKRSPENINYNELFKDENQNKSKKKKLDKKPKDDNIYNFVDRVNEKQNFEKLFSQDNEKNKTVDEYHILNKINVRDSLANPNILILPISQPIQKEEKVTGDLIEFNSRPNGKNLDPIEEILKNESDTKNDDDENSERMKKCYMLNNSGIFQETPLTRIKNNNLVKSSII
jgi:hypothetical protein